MAKAEKLGRVMSVAKSKMSGKGHSKQEKAKKLGRVAAVAKSKMSRK